MEDRIFSNEEMCREFRLAKNKTEQIKIFMECNLMSEEQVRDILKAGGITLNGVMRVKKTQPANTEKTKTPQEVIDVVNNHIRKMKSDAQDALDEISRMSEAVDEMDHCILQLEKWVKEVKNEEE